MIYVTSDLHGYSLEKFKELLNCAGFNNSDYLFVLGDVIDRGPYGIDLLRWMTEQPNIELILGNHEAMLLACDFVFDAVTDSNLAKLDTEKFELLDLWMKNGAAPTLSGLRKLMKESPDVLEGILDYLRDAPLYDTVDIDGVEYIMVHSGLENFAPDKPLGSYSSEDLLWARPTLETTYYDDGRILVFGHTPTECIDPQFNGRAIFLNGWICIDTGAATGNKPMLLRLDDMATFY